MTGVPGDVIAVTAVTAVIGGTDVTAVTGETGGDVAGMTGVTSDVFAVTTVTAVTGALDVPVVTGETGRPRRDVRDRPEGLHLGGRAGQNRCSSQRDLGRRAFSTALKGRDS